MSDIPVEPPRAAHPIPFTGDQSAIKASRMATLLSIEAAARESSDMRALAMHLVNDPRTLTPFDQGFCVKRIAGEQFKSVAVTAQSDFNPHAPSIQMVERFAQEIAKTRNPEENFNFSVDALKTEWTSEQNAYPFRYWTWLPIISPIHYGEKKLLGGLLLARQTPWRDLDLVVLKRIVDTYAHAWALQKAHRKSTAPRTKHKFVIASLIAIAAVAALFLPVAYTVVAPAQIIAANPTIISSPIDGVIDNVHVYPNQTVSDGDALVTFVDTSLRNNADVASSELFLAQARRANTNRAAIIDAEQRRDLAILDAERTIAATKRQYANELLANVKLNAPQAGIALFSDRAELSGKPVITGQKIMEIADPDLLEIMVEIAPGDAAALQVGQKVSVFLDANPLKPLRGRLQRANYIPSEGNGGQLVYKGFVTLDHPETPLARIGLRGTAKLDAGKTSLGFWLFRKPIAMARRHIGV